jgi:hypothetical protein
MSEVTSSEYLNSLLVAYQYAEKVYGQSVTDVVTAEIRRDEALNAKNDAFKRLEEARSRFKGGGANGNGKSNSSSPPRQLLPPLPQSTGQAPAPTTKVPLTPPVSRKSLTATSGSVSKIQAPLTAPAAREMLSSRMGDPQMGHIKSPLTPQVAGRKSTARHSVAVMSGSTSNDAQLDKQAHRTRTSRIMRAIEFGKVEPHISVFDICKGRTPEWLEENLDSDALGLVKKFAQASFGTKTFEKTKKVKVYTILLNDEWNELVRVTESIQEMYIGSNTNPHAKPTLRDRAAEALVSPPRQDPIALFLSPKQEKGTSDVFYAGHWTVMDGKMLDPPRMVRGQMRQALVKLTFVGVDQSLVDAINQDSS